MQVSVASIEDLEFIESAYEHARAFMRANGNATQWPDEYPGRIDAEEDIARGHCFLVADDEGPLAVFTLAPGPDETYAKIDGAWHSEAEYHVIHRVAAVRGRGVAGGRLGARETRVKPGDCGASATCGSPTSWSDSLDAAAMH